MNDVRNTINTIRPLVDAALAKIAAENGLSSLKLGRGTFSPDGSFTIKLEGVMSGGLTKDAQRYNVLRERLPEFPELGTEAARISYGRKKIELTGANTTLSKVIFTDLENGKSYLAPMPMIRMALQAAKAVRP